MNHPNLLLALALPLLMAACSKPAKIDQATDAAIFNAGEVEKPLVPGVVPVRIGDGGPRFAACGGTGQVWNLSPDGEASLTVRSAPFAEAGKVAELGNGAKLSVCARSMDQRWLGVVIPPASAPDSDCGTAAPAAAPRPYSGPCLSGWVTSAFVRLSAR
jgi:hypothetical protein